MKVSVIVPDEYLGTVIGDLTSRRGQIQGQEARPGAQQVDALVPLANMFGYATDLRSNTQGRGQYTMEPQLRRDSQEHPRQDRGGAGQESRLIQVLLFPAGYCKIYGAMKRTVHINPLSFI